MADLGEIVAQLERVLGPAAGAPVALDGGITNRNFRLRFGDRDCVLRLPGKDTGLLGIDREAERLAVRAGRPPGDRPGGDRLRDRLSRHRVPRRRADRA